MNVIPHNTTNGNLAVHSSLWVPHVFDCTGGRANLFLPSELLQRPMLSLVAFATGSLIGGALFQIIPSTVEKMGNTTEVCIWLAAGFVLFCAPEQFLNRHHSCVHSHACSPSRAPQQCNHPCAPPTGPISSCHACGLDCKMVQSDIELMRTHCFPKMFKSNCWC